MAKVKLGSKEFDVDSEEIAASDCGVSDADCAAFAARMKTGEISRVKELDLVSCFVLFCWNANMSFAEQQPSRRRGSEGYCCRSATEQQRADVVPCKMIFVVVFYVLNLGLLFYRRA